PDVLYISFSGFITAHEPETPLEDSAKIAGTIKISGKPEVTLL
ncbi:MAG: phage tail protein, partial [Chloroflexi bacterium]|nr:phage tail protein [Chloroflexota bacterium]